MYGLASPDPSAASTEQGDRRGSKEAETHSKGVVKQESDDRPIEAGEGAEGKVLSKAELKRQRREKQVGCRWSYIDVNELTHSVLLPLKLLLHVSSSTSL